MFAKPASLYYSAIQSCRGKNSPSVRAEATPRVLRPPQKWSPSVREIRDDKARRESGRVGATQISTKSRERRGRCLEKESPSARALSRYFSALSFLAGNRRTEGFQRETARLSLSRDGISPYTCTHTYRQIHTYIEVRLGPTRGCPRTELFAR